MDRGIRGQHVPGIFRSVESAENSPFKHVYQGSWLRYCNQDSFRTIETFTHTTTQHRMWRRSRVCYPVDDSRQAYGSTVVNKMLSNQEAEDTIVSITMLYATGHTRSAVVSQ
jgi:hypothetical protein